MWLLKTGLLAKDVPAILEVVPNQHLLLLLGARSTEEGEGILRLEGTRILGVHGVHVRPQEDGLTVLLLLWVDLAESGLSLRAVAKRVVPNTTGHLLRHPVVIGHTKGSAAVFSHRILVGEAVRELLEPWGISETLLLVSQVCLAPVGIARVFRGEARLAAAWRIGPRLGGYLLLHLGQKFQEVGPLAVQEVGWRTTCHLLLLLMLWSDARVELVMGLGHGWHEVPLSMVIAGIGRHLHLLQ